MKIFFYFFSLLKSFFFNFKHLPFKQAVHLPFIISVNTEIDIKGKIILLSVSKFASIRIGFHKAPAVDSKRTSLIIENKGICIFEGTAHIGNGSKIYIGQNAQLSLGNEFAISASSAIICYKSIVIGNDVQLSWDNLIMDSDTHDILDEENVVINPNKAIIIDDKVWVGCRCTILKGSHIPHDCVVGACSLVSGIKFEPNSIIAGTPAKSVKKIKTFNI